MGPDSSLNSFGSSFSSVSFLKAFFSPSSLLFMLPEQPTLLLISLFSGLIMQHKERHRSVYSHTGKPNPSQLSTVRKGMWEGSLRQSQAFCWATRDSIPFPPASSCLGQRAARLLEFTKLVLLTVLLSKASGCFWSGQEWSMPSAKIVVLCSSGISTVQKSWLPTKGLLA